MITGTVNPYREPIIRFLVRGHLGQEDEIEAVVDTGFTGSLTLPPALIAALSLPFRRRGRAILADGSECLFNVFEATVVWDGQPRRAAVECRAGFSRVPMSSAAGSAPRGPGRSNPSRAFESRH